MTATKRLSITRQPPITPELWRDAYARIAAQYAVFLERYDLAEDAQAEDIILAIEAEVRSDLARQVAGLKMAAVYPDGRPDRNGYAGGWNDALEALAIFAGTDATPTQEEAGLDVADRLGALLHGVTAMAVTDEPRRRGWQSIETPLRKAWLAAKRLPLSEHTRTLPAGTDATPEHEVAPFDNRCAVCAEPWPCPFAGTDATPEPPE